MSFQILPLPRAAFAPFFALDDAALAARGARRMTADAPSAFPCRISLRDAPQGAPMLLVNHTHLDAPSPYRAAHAVYVDETAQEAQLAPGEIPDSIARRMLALRSYDHAAMMLEADIGGGSELPGLIARLFDNPAAQMIHIHYAKRGCFAAQVARAADPAPIWL